MGMPSTASSNAGSMALVRETRPAERLLPRALPAMGDLWVWDLESEVPPVAAITPDLPDRACICVRHPAAVRLVEPVVDALPERLWRPGNLYSLPAGDWHFCVGDDPRLGRPVRTIEWRSREIARGRRRFNFTAHDGNT
jgi:hypothetical protein